jgi:predicted ATPase/class 3 adenylate cyclase
VTLTAFFDNCTVARELPRGTVTFVFTDVEGSTKLLQELGAEGYARALPEHRRVLREALARYGGVEVDTQGDSFFVAFPTAPAALAAAREATAALASGPIRVRIGVHTGTPLLTEEGYVGADVHRAARIAAAGHGGQVLVSASTAALVETSSLRDLGEHRFKDLAAAERVFQLGNDDFPPLRSLYRTNLPVPATPFLGRERELAEVVQLLSLDHVRLLTLTGPGGTGKTRLALRAAAEAAEQFGDGVIWVPLAPLREPSLMLPTVAQALGVKEQPGAPLAERLASGLRGRRSLLMLDNAEHLLPDAAEAVRVLRDADGPTVLVTSRERLQLQGEQAWPVPPLQARDGEELFLARARAVDPAFMATPQVAELCRRLDELPLAIELAAARTAVFSPDQMLDRIGQRLDLFKAGRDVDPRQQTLRATIEWSHALLSEEEQRLFHRLGVFAGGCTLDAAEQVADADPDTLQALLDKSLIRRRAVDDGQLRYMMLETIREYALERLVTVGEEPQTRRRHAAYFRNLAEQAESELTGPDQTAWLNRLDAEYGNLRESLNFSFEHGDPETALRLSAALWGFWLERGYLSEGRRWLDAAHEARTRVSPATRAHALNGAGILAHYQGDYGQAEALCGESLTIYRELDDKHGIASALSAHALATRTRGDFGAAQAMFEEALAIFRQLGDKQGVARTLDRLGIAVWFQGDDEQARGLLDESLAVFTELADAEGIGLALVDLGLVALSQADYGAARPLLEESLAAFKEVGDRRNVCKALYALGDLDAGQRDYVRAARHYQESLAISLDVGVPWFTALCLERLAGVAVATGDPEGAARLFGAGEVLREAIGAPMPAYFRRLYERDLAETRARLDEQRFATALHEGRTMSPVNAISTLQL